MSETETVDPSVIMQLLIQRGQTDKELRLNLDSAIHEARVMQRDQTIKALEEALAAKGKDGAGDTGTGGETAVANISDAKPRRSS